LPSASICTLFIMLMLCSGGLCHAQDTGPLTGEQKKEIRTRKRAEKIASGRPLLTPVAAPGYTPELGGLLALGGLASFKTNPGDSLIQRSSLPFTVGYTTTGAIVANAILTSYWFRDRMRIYGDFWYKDMPDHYWGVGYKNGASVPQSDTTTLYNRQWWWINPRFLFQLRNDCFIGLNVDLNYTLGSDASDGVASDQDYMAVADQPMNVGLGLIIRYDSRDVPVDAREGFYIDLRSTLFSTALGGDNDYQVFLLDYRHFKTVKREGITLAWQAKARIGTGAIPYGEMSQLGTPFDLRGYTWGRFRDKCMCYFIAEYRHSFLKGSGELSRHGAVAWIGSGTVFDFQTVEENSNSWLPNFGVGYRLEVQPRMNMRLDFGLGRETSGFYFNFNQAF
jgi:hypothetical protein